MKSLISELKLKYPELKFRTGKQFYWSPETNEIFYKNSKFKEEDKWSLLHETGHALLKHKTYSADFELIKLEINAWDKAVTIGRKLKVMIDQNHIQDCLDTYRDWLYKRSICPTCSTKCLQQQDYVHYRCFNCHTTWRVSPNRFCRSYRTTEKPEDSLKLAFFDNKNSLDD